MKRWVLVAVVVSLSFRVARAGDGDDDLGYKCHTADPSTKIGVTFKPETSVRDLATWALGFTCRNIVFSSDIATNATRVTVMAPNKLTPKQALQLFVDSLEAAGLVVVVKPDTIIIKPGPNTPHNCPAVASTGGVSSTISAAQPPEEPPITEAEIDAGIKVIDDTHREVSAKLVDKILLNPMAVANGARVVPAVKDGKPEGFKLYAIRPSSLFAKLGFTNGDTMISVNGMQLVSADKALEVYTKVRDAKKLEVAIIRRGKAQTIVLTIR